MYAHMNKQVKKKMKDRKVKQVLSGDRYQWEGIRKE
jgi:hypothetical protein